MDPDRQLGPFDPRLRALRAGRRRLEARYLHRRAIDDLIERLALVARAFRTAFLIGPDAELAARLSEAGLTVAQGEAEDLIERPGAYDLIASVGLLDTINDLPGALVLARRALTAEGLFLAAFAGAGSLPALRGAMRAGEEAEGKGASPRIHPQIDVRAAGDLMLRAGFALPVVDRDVVEVRYESLPQLVADLRAMGATNQLAGRGAPPFGRIGLTAAIVDFAAQAGPDGKIAERFELIHVSGWAKATV
ncbi:MAG TPA: SAM-dependent methyltransferase [Allosphingosinicella sp.]|nr:SAM-dependent methyltransferase [Allosphingosinicella sp.]